MSVITLTSDLGTGSHYVAILKAGLFSLLPGSQVVDISHEVQPFNLVQAAFMLNYSWKHFPAGTVHIIAVDTATAEHKRHLVAEAGGQYFIAADNGVLSLLAEGTGITYYKIRPEDYGNRLFEASYIYTRVGALLAEGRKPSELGDRVDDARILSSHVATIVDNTLVGTVVFVDRFQNAFTNVNRGLFDQFRGDDRFAIRLGRHERIFSISSHYSDVPAGEKLALFGDNDLLQIAINKGGAGGGAAQLLGLQVGSKFIIEKDDRKNSKNAI